MSAINHPHPCNAKEAISDLRYIALEDYIAPHWSARLEKIAAMLEELSWLREEGRQEGIYDTVKSADDAFILPAVPKPTKLRRQQGRNGSYAMVPAYTKSEMQAYAAEAVAIYRQKVQGQ